jgi:eukaryotic-like serine/threonine-protein kinase
MLPERWQQVEEIFQTALDLAPEERARYITKACTGDDDLQREVEALLTQYESAGDFLDAPLQGSGMHALGALMEEDPLVGRRIGAYKIEREIGRGGMGAVYLATRADNAFQRRVAIKVIKRGMDTDFILRRFRHERRILAALDHQNIARLLDGGATETGLPYFVMEYIEGQPLYTYCDARRLNVRERLRLFCQVCDAVEYAHQNQVIHRDIKPSNILVTANGVPKLFDFGIAKLLNTEMATDTAPQTATAMRMMTVEYASPEQVQGLPVTFLSDVYSLGVLLYELLTGHRPYHFRSRMLHEMARVISEEEPELLSQAVNRTDNLLPVAHVDQEAITIGHLCEMRNETPDSLRGELSGDLDNITLKALRKEPAERYQSAASLREDITRYLEGRPVSAPFYFPSAKSSAPAPETHLQAPAKAIAVLPLKILNLGPADDTGDKFMSIGLADAMITRLSGVRSLAVRPTSAVLRYGDETVDPVEAGREMGVNFVLDGRIKIAGDRIRVSLQLLDIQSGTSIWANQFDERFTDALELEDSISSKVADALLPELTEDARRQFRKRGTDNPQAFEAYMRGRYFWNRFTAESLPKALEAFQAAIALDPNYALPYVGIADFYIWGCIYGLLPPTEGYARAKEATLRALGLDDQLAEGYAALALIAENMWDWAEAERLYQKALEFAPNYPLTHEWYASMLVGTGRFEEGDHEIRRAEELDPLSLRAMALSAWSFYQTRDYTEGIAKAQQIIDLDKDYPQGYLQLGNCLDRVGRAAEAVEALRRCIELMPESTLPIYNLCFALVGAGRVGEARQVLAELKKRAATLYVKPYFLAMAHVALDERDAAFELFEQVFAERDPWLIWFGTEPKLDGLRSDPRFIELFHRTNNPLAARRSTLYRNVDTGGHEKSIAVLPLKFLGLSDTGDTGDKYLGIGLSDALITLLSNLRRLIVRPTSSVLPYGGEDADPLVAGRELGVDLVLDGRIRRIGEHIRISLQLLEVKSGSNVWAYRFDERFTDALSVEDAISEQVTKALVPHLTGEERLELKKGVTSSPKAFEAYLRGRYHWNTFTPDGFGKAFTAYQDAINIDPSYALAYVGIADFYIWMGIYGMLPPKESFASAREAVTRALGPNDNLAEAHATLGFIEQINYEWEASESHFRRALELNPKLAITHLWYSTNFLRDGRFDEGLNHTRRALELDPLTPFNQYYLGWCLYYARRFEASVLEYQRCIAAHPLYMLGYLGLAWTLRHMGRHEEALKAVQRGQELSTDSPFVSTIYGQTLAAAGKRQEALEVLADLDRQTGGRPVLLYQRALLRCLLGEKEAALEMLERAYEEKDAWLVWMGIEPQFDPLLEDARFITLLNRLQHKG